MKMLPETSSLGKYFLCPNSKIKFTFFVGILLQVSALALAIAMLSTGGWVTVRLQNGDPNNRFSLTRAEGILVDCYPDIQPDAFLPKTISKCYMKDFGQHATADSNTYQRHIAIAGATLVTVALFVCASDIGLGLHLCFIWFRAPFDSFFMRTYRLLVSFWSAVTSCLFLATMALFHVGLRLDVQRIPREQTAETQIEFNHGYYVAWACFGASAVAAWATVSSTCYWAVDYVSCRSVAAAFNPTCSQRASTLSMNNGIRSSVYGLNADGVWSIQEQLTLPRYNTSTYGDGSEIRNKRSEIQLQEVDKNAKIEEIK